jgi:hypothetical protein
VKVSPFWFPISKLANLKNVWFFSTRGELGPRKRVAALRDSDVSDDPRAVQQYFRFDDLRGSAAIFGSAPSAFALYCQRSS